MKEINVSRITDVVARLCIEANRILPDDIKAGLCSACEQETNELGRAVLCDLKENIKAAEGLCLPVCQDTGMAVVFLELGQDVHLAGGNLYDAVNLGVKKGYTEGLLRKSVVCDP